MVGGEEFRVPPPTGRPLIIPPPARGNLGNLLQQPPHLDSLNPSRSCRFYRTSLFPNLPSLSCATKIFSFFIQKISGDDGDRLVLGVHAHSCSYLGIRSRGSSTSAPFPPGLDSSFFVQELPEESKFFVFWFRKI